MIEIMQDGKQYTTVGEYRPVVEGDLFINEFGDVVRKFGPTSLKNYLIVEEVKKQHTFSGIVFEEVDGPVMPGDWYVSKETNNIARHFPTDTTPFYKQQKLIPIRVVGAEHE